MRRRGGITFTKDGRPWYALFVVTGEMADGRKVWTECNSAGEPINLDKQYFLTTRGGLSEFIPV